MTEQDWQNGKNKALGMLINGQATDDSDERGRPIRDDTMLLLTNSSPDEVKFILPKVAPEGMWAELIDTRRDELRMIGAGWVGMAPHSLVLLRFGRDRRLVTEAPSREEIIAEAPEALSHGA